MPAGRPKGSGGVNKSAAIRDYLNNHPEASTTEVMEALGSKGIDVSRALVAGVRARAFSGGSSIRKKSIVASAEISEGEMRSVSAIIEKFEEPEMIMGVMNEICGVVKELGGVERFEKALASYAESEGSSMESSDDDDEEEEISEEEDSEDEDE